MVNDSAPPDSGSSALRKRGEEVRSELFGDATPAGGGYSWSKFNQPLRDYIVESAFANIWDRPGLDRRTRSAITLAMLTVLRAHDELSIHTLAAARNGLSTTEIREVLLQTAIYAGVPASLGAFAEAESALQQAGYLAEDGELLSSDPAL